MNPTILLIRHAPTSLNNPSTEAIRGHSDIPISGEGAEHLQQTATFLKKSGFSILHILSSPLQRGMMTAQIIADAMSAKITPDNHLLPWDLGDMTGQEIKDVAPKMDYYQEYPDLRVPGGEKYRDFYDRWTEGIKKMQAYAEKHPHEVLAGVVHSRNLLALPSILGRKPIGDVPVKGGPEPGAVVKITKSGDHWVSQIIFEQEL